MQFCSTPPGRTARKGHSHSVLVFAQCLSSTKWINLGCRTERRDNTHRRRRERQDAVRATGLPGRSCPGQEAAPRTCRCCTRRTGCRRGTCMHGKPDRPGRLAVSLAIETPRSTVYPPSRTPRTQIRTANKTHAYTHHAPRTELTRAV